jgi:hypothetical protein
MDRMLELAAGGASLNSPLAAFVLTSLIIEIVHVHQFADWIAPLEDGSDA